MFTVEIGDLVPLIGGQALAAKFADADAARVHRLLVDAPAVNFYHSSQRMSYYTGLLWGLVIDGQSILCTPDTGYAISSMLRSCMLVDGKGQIGDTGYPMPLPSMPHRGEEIEMVRWDPDPGRHH